MDQREKAAFDWVAKCDDRKSLAQYEDNARTRAAKLGGEALRAVLEACAAKLSTLRKTSAPRRSRPVAAPSTPKPKLATYRGAFPKELDAFFAAKPDEPKLAVMLPLARRDGAPLKPTVNIEVGWDDRQRNYVKDADTGLFHGSLSAVRKAHEDEGSGSDSWSKIFDPKTGKSIAETIGVDPADAHESMGRKAKR